jgi:hypothetical protein
MLGSPVSLMKSTLSDCESNRLKESASVAQLWSAPEARALRDPFPIGGLLRSTEVVPHRPAMVH